jgi:hypothetical protein
MFREGVREPGCIVRVWTKEHTAHRALILASPNAFAVAASHHSLQAYFLSSHVGSVRLLIASEKVSLTHNAQKWIAIGLDYYVLLS